MNVQRETSHSCTAESGRAESVKVFPNCSKYTGKPRTEKGENQMKEFSHLAYLIPHTDVTGEIDCHRMLLDCVVHVKRMWLDEVSEEAERKMVQEELPRALHYLTERHHKLSVRGVWLHVGLCGQWQRGNAGH